MNSSCDITFIGSPDSLPPIQENNLYVNNRLTKDTHKKKPDELYYIYFQDSEKKGGGDGDSQARVATNNSNYLVFE